MRMNDRLPARLNGGIGQRDIVPWRMQGMWVMKDEIFLHVRKARRATLHAGQGAAECRLEFATRFL